jgi:hypothetical protein
MYPGDNKSGVAPWIFSEQSLRGVPPHRTPKRRTEQIVELAEPVRVQRKRALDGRAARGRCCCVRLSAMWNIRPIGLNQACRPRTPRSGAPLPNRRSRSTEIASACRNRYQVPSYPARLDLSGASPHRTDVCHTIPVPTGATARSSTIVPRPCAPGIRRGVSLLPLHQVGVHPPGSNTTATSPLEVQVPAGSFPVNGCERSGWLPLGALDVVHLVRLLMTGVLAPS